jgi:hypothetical protein
VTPAAVSSFSLFVVMAPVLLLIIFCSYFLHFYRLVLRIFIFLVFDIDDLDSSHYIAIVNDSSFFLTAQQIDAKEAEMSTLKAQLEAARHLIARSPCSQSHNMLTRDDSGDVVGVRDLLRELVKLEEKAASSSLTAPPHMDVPSSVDGCRGCKKAISYPDPRRNCEMCGHIFCVICSTVRCKQQQKHQSQQYEALCSGCAKA